MLKRAGLGVLVLGALVAAATFAIVRMNEPEPRWGVATLKPHGESHEVEHRFFDSEAELIAYMKTRTEWPPVQ